MPVSARLGACLLTLALAAAASAAGWSSYGNARYAYAVEIPPGFSPIREADNGDGGVSRSPIGHAVLSVWGANLIDETFSQDVGSRISTASTEGWTIGYRVVTAAGAVWSGTRGERIVYARAVPHCSDQAAYLRIEYDAAAKAEFDPIVSRLARSLKAGRAC